MDVNLNLMQRLILALAAFWHVLVDRAFARDVFLLRRGQPTPLSERPDTVPGRGTEPSTTEAQPAAEPARTHAESLHLLAVLQRDGRLIDFLSESLDGFSDREIGAAARTVHEGCKKALDAYLDLEPIFTDPEGARVTVPTGFDPSTVRLTGNVVGSPPFQGSLKHHGWRARRVDFPPLPEGQDIKVLAPAEVEL